MKLACLLGYVLVLGLAACGQNDEDKIRETVEAYFSALADGDGPAACDELTTNARTELVQLGAEAGVGTIDCEEIADDLSSLIGESDANTLRNAEITEIEINGDEATATVEGATAEPTLVKSGADWQIDSGLLQAGGSAATPPDPAEQPGTPENIVQTCAEETGQNLGANQPLPEFMTCLEESGAPDFVIKAWGG